MSFNVSVVSVQVNYHGIHCLYRNKDEVTNRINNISLQKSRSFKT